ncbi:hypothetical protein [Lysinibacillus fusiformis]|uniref:hypothetical protein n=1 Tax=Lysinibacillus fusiformis TaxID=28031 RepID=UPI00301A1CE4
MGDVVSIKLQAWWLLVIPLFLFFSLFIIALIMKGKTNEEEKSIEKEREKKKTLTSWIEKKDILYWLLIMCLSAISIFTYQYSGDKDAISHWGFAGTIVSIILAVVAIGFTLFQTLSSNLSSEKIADSADKIERVTNSLDTETLIESGNIMNNAADFLKDKISVIEERLHSLDAEQKRFNEIAATGFSGVDINRMDGSLGSQEVYNIQKFINKIYPNLPYYSRLFIYTYFHLNMMEIYLSDAVQKELIKVVTDYDRDIKGFEGTYRDGANMASQGATFSFVFNLGILNQFIESSKGEQEYILGKCEEALVEQIEYLTLMNGFINEKKINNA